MTLLPAIILLLFALVLYLVARFLPNFSYFWLLAAGGVAASWVIILGLRLIVPFPSDFQRWVGSEILRSELVLTWDSFSWQFSLALCTLALGVILTEVVRAPDGDWSSWAAGFLLSGVGLLTLLAGNLFTLFLELTALDLISSLSVFEDEKLAKARVQILVARLVGTGLILLTGLWVASDYSGQGVFILGLLFFLGCVFRLGLPGKRHLALPRGLGVLFDLIPAITGLVVIFRLTPIAVAGIGSQALYIFVILLVGMISGIRWAGGENLGEGRLFWSLGLAALFTLGVLLDQPEAGIVWGLGLVYAGGALFLYRLQTPWQVAIPAIGLWTVSALPFAPSSVGFGFFQTPILPSFYLALPLHGLLLAGFLRQLFLVEPEKQGAERWVLLIFPAGLILLLAVYIVVSLLPWQGLDLIRLVPLWPGFVTSALGGVFWWVFRQGDFGSYLQKILSFVTDFSDLILRPIISVLKGVSGLMSTLSLILEGPGGILWAFLLIVLILSLISQVDLGGFPLGN